MAEIAPPFAGWDAISSMSAALAEKLGCHAAAPYTACRLELPADA